MHINLQNRLLLLNGLGSAGRRRVWFAQRLEAAATLSAV